MTEIDYCRYDLKNLTQAKLRQRFQGDDWKTQYSTCMHDEAAVKVLLDEIIEVTEYAIILRDTETLKGCVDVQAGCVTGNALGAQLYQEVGLSMLNLFALDDCTDQMHFVHQCQAVLGVQADVSKRCYSVSTPPPPVSTGKGANAAAVAPSPVITILYPWLIVFVCRLSVHALKGVAQSALSPFLGVFVDLTQSLQLVLTAVQVPTTLPPPLVNGKPPKEVPLPIGVVLPADPLRVVNGVQSNMSAFFIGGSGTFQMHELFQDITLQCIDISLVAVSSTVWSHEAVLTPAPQTVLAVTPLLEGIFGNFQSTYTHLISLTTCCSSPQAFVPPHALQKHKNALYSAVRQLTVCLGSCRLLHSSIHQLSAFFIASDRLFDTAIPLVNPDVLEGAASPLSYVSSHLQVVSSIALLQHTLIPSTLNPALMLSACLHVLGIKPQGYSSTPAIATQPYMYGLYNPSALLVSETRDPKDKTKISTVTTLLPKVQAALNSLSTAQDISLAMNSLSLETLELLPAIARVCLLHKCFGLAQLCMLLSQQVDDEVLEAKFPTLSALHQASLGQLTDTSDMLTLRKDRAWSVWYPLSVALTRVLGHTALQSFNEHVDRSMHVDYAQYWHSHNSSITPNAAFASLPGLPHPTVAKKTTKGKSNISEQVEHLCMLTLPVAGSIAKGSAGIPSGSQLAAVNPPSTAHLTMLAHSLQPILERIHDVLQYSLSSLKDHARTHHNQQFQTQSPQCIVTDLVSGLFPILRLFYSKQYFDNSTLMRCVSMLLALTAHQSARSPIINSSRCDIPVEKSFYLSYQPLFTTDRLIPMFSETMQFFMQYNVVKHRYIHVAELAQFLHSTPTYSVVWEHKLSTYLTVGAKDKQPAATGIASRLIDAAGPDCVIRVGQLVPPATGGLLQSPHGLLLLRVEQLYSEDLFLVAAFAAIHADNIGAPFEGLESLHAALQCKIPADAMVLLGQSPAYGGVSRSDARYAVERLQSKLKLQSSEKLGLSKGRGAAAAHDNSASSALLAHVNEVLLALADRDRDAIAQLIQARLWLLLARMSDSLTVQIKCLLSCILTLDPADESLSQNQANTVVCGCITLFSQIKEESTSNLEEIRAREVIQDTAAVLREDEQVDSTLLSNLKLAALKYAIELQSLYPSATGIAAALQSVYIDSESALVSLYHTSRALWTCTATNSLTHPQSHSLPVCAQSSITAAPLSEHMQTLLCELAQVCITHYNVRDGNSSVIDTIFPLLYPSFSAVPIIDLPSHNNGSTLLPSLLVPLSVSLAATKLLQCMTLLNSALSVLPTLYVLELIPLWTHLMVVPLLNQEPSVKPRASKLMEEGKKQSSIHSMSSQAIFDPFANFLFPPNPVLAAVCVATLCTMPKQVLSVAVKKALVMNITTIQTASLKTSVESATASKNAKPASPPAVLKTSACLFLQNSLVEAAKASLLVGKGGKLGKLSNSTAPPALLPYSATDYALLPMFPTYTAQYTSQKTNSVSVLSHFSSLDHTLLTPTHASATYLATLDHALSASLAWQLIGEDSAAMVNSFLLSSPPLPTLPLQDSALYLALQAFYSPAELHVPGKGDSSKTFAPALLSVAFPCLLAPAEQYLASCTVQVLALPLPEPSPSAAASRKHMPVVVPLVCPSMDNVTMYSSPTLNTALQLVPATAASSVIPESRKAMLTFLFFVNNLATSLSLSTKSYTNNALVLLHACVAVMSQLEVSAEDLYIRDCVERCLNYIVNDILVCLPDSSLNLDQGVSVHRQSIFSQTLLNTLATTLILCDLVKPKKMAKQARVLRSTLYFHLFFLLSKILCTSQYTAHYSKIHALLSNYLSPKEVPRFIVFRIISEAETGKDLSSLTPLLSNAMNVDKAQAAGVTTACEFRCCGVKQVMIGHVFSQAVNTTCSLHAQLTAIREAYKNVVRCHARTHVLEVVVICITWCANVLMQSGAAHVVVSGSSETAVPTHLAPSTLDAILHSSAPVNITGETIDALLSFVLHLAMPILTEDRARNMYFTCKTFQSIPDSSTTCAECHQNFGCSAECIESLRAFTAVQCLTLLPVMLFRSQDSEQTKAILDQAGLMCTRVMQYLISKVRAYRNASSALLSIATWQQHVPSLTDDQYQFTQAGAFNHNIQDFVTLPVAAETELPVVPTIDSAAELMHIDLEEFLSVLGSYSALPALKTKPGQAASTTLQVLEQAVERELSNTCSLALSREQCQAILLRHGPSSESPIYEGIFGDEILRPLFGMSASVAQMVHNHSRSSSLPTVAQFLSKLLSLSAEDSLQLAPIHALSAALATVALVPKENIFRLPVYSGHVVIGVNRIDHRNALLKPVDTSSIDLVDARALNLLPVDCEPVIERGSTSCDLFDHYGQSRSDSDWYFLDLLRRLALAALHEMELFPVLSVPSNTHLYIIAANVAANAAVVVHDKQAQLHALTAHHPLLVAKDSCYAAPDALSYSATLVKTCSAHLPAAAQPVILQSPLVLLRLANLLIHSDPLAAQNIMKYVDICMFILEKPGAIIFPNRDREITAQARVFLGNASRTNLTRLIQITHAVINYIHGNSADTLKLLQTAVTVQHGGSVSSACAQCSTNSAYESVSFNSVKLHLIHNTAFAITPSFAASVGISPQALAPSSCVNANMESINTQLQQLPTSRGCEHLVRLLLVRAVLDLVGCRAFTLPSHLACLLLAHCSGKHVDLSPLVHAARTRAQHLNSDTSFAEQFQLSLGVLQTLSLAADAAKKANNMRLWCTVLRMLVVVKTCLFLYGKALDRSPLAITMETTELCLELDLCLEDLVLYYSHNNTGYGALVPGLPAESSTLAMKVVSDNFEASAEMFLFSSVGHLRDVYTALVLPSLESGSQELSVQGEIPTLVCFLAEASQVMYLLHHTCIDIGLRQMHNILVSPSERAHVLAMLSSNTHQQKVVKNASDIPIVYGSLCTCKAAALCSCSNSPTPLHVVLNLLGFLQQSLHTGCLCFPRWDVLITNKSDHDVLRNGALKDQDNWIHAVYIAETVSVLSELTRFYGLAHQLAKLPKYNPVFSKTFRLALTEQKEQKELVDFGIESLNLDVSNDPIAVQSNLAMNMTAVEVEPVKPARNSSGSAGGSSIQQQHNVGGLHVLLQNLLNAVPLPRNTSLSALYSAATLHSSICSGLQDYSEEELDLFKAEDLDSLALLNSNSALAQSVMILQNSMSLNSISTPVPTKTSKNSTDSTVSKKIDHLKRGKKVVVDTPVAAQPMPLVVECAEAAAAALVAELLGQKSGPKNVTTNASLHSNMDSLLVEPIERPYLPLVLKRVQTLALLLEVLPLACTILSRGGFYLKLLSTLEQACFGLLRSHSVQAAAFILVAEHLRDRLAVLHLAAGVGESRTQTSHLLPKQLLASQTQFSPEAIELMRVYLAPRPVMAFPDVLQDIACVTPVIPEETPISTLLISALHALAVDSHSLHSAVTPATQQSFYVPSAYDQQQPVLYSSFGIGSDWVIPQINSSAEFSIVQEILAVHPIIVNTLVGEHRGVCSLFTPLLHSLSESLTVAHCPVFVSTLIPAVNTPTTFVTLLQAGVASPAATSASSSNTTKQSRGKRVDRTGTNRGTQAVETASPEKGQTLVLGVARSTDKAASLCGLKGENHYSDTFQRTHEAILHAFARALSQPVTAELEKTVLAILLLVFTEPQLQSGGMVARKQTKGKSSTTQKTVLAVLPLLLHCASMGLAAHHALARRALFAGFVPQTLHRHLFLHDVEQRLCSNMGSATTCHVSCALKKLPPVASKRSTHNYSSMRNSLAAVVHEFMQANPTLGSDFGITPTQSSTLLYSNEKGVLTMLPSPPESPTLAYSLMPQHLYIDNHADNGLLYRAGIHLLLFLNVTNIGSCVSPRSDIGAAVAGSLFAMYNSDDKRKRGSSTTGLVCPFLHEPDNTVSVISAKSVDVEPSTGHFTAGYSMFFSDSLQMQSSLQPRPQSTTVVQYINEYVRRNEHNQALHTATLLADRMNTNLLMLDPAIEQPQQQQLEVIALWALLSGTDLSYFTNTSAKHLDLFVQQLQATAKHIETLIQTAQENVQNVPQKKPNNKGHQQVSEDLPMLRFITEQFRKVEGIVFQNIVYIQATPKTE